MDCDYWHEIRSEEVGVSGTVDFIVNGKSVHVDTDGTTPLLSVLRDELALRGSRFGCGTEQCGACMVLIDGEPSYACSREIESVAGRAVTTVEGLWSDDRLHPLRQAFLDEQAGQCGYCLSGILISAAALLARNPRPSRAEIAAALDRHLCRCGAHNRILRAVARAGAADRDLGMISNTLPQSLIDNPILSQWIGFEEPGRVRVGSGKVEIGQGILTALTQIAAEELDVAPEQLHLVSGQTDVSPAEGFTSGSYSVAVGGASIRLVCAEVRSLFLDRLADKLNCPIGELSVADGKFLRNGKETGRDYWSIAGEVVLERRASGTAPTKLPSAYRIVGRNLPRVDLPAKLDGEAFIHDIAPENVVHARVLRQPWRGARLAALDEAAVRRAAKAPIEILREGDFVAFTAESEIAVMRAAEAARALARWDGGEPAPAGIGEADWLKAQPSRDRTVESGLPGRAEGNRRLQALYTRPFLTYASIGPSCALAEFRGRRAQGVVALPGSGGAARLDRQGARLASVPRSPCSTARAPAPTATTPPTMPPSTQPSSPRRCRGGRYAYSCRARTSSRPRRSAPPWRSSFRPCSARTIARPTGPSKSGARRTPSAPA